MKKIFLLLLMTNCLAVSFNLHGQKSAQKKSAGWTTSSFEQKVFIENKGQFDGQNGNESAKILYSTSCEGVDLYFTANGLIYKHNEWAPMSEEEISRSANNSSGHSMVKDEKKDKEERGFKKEERKMKVAARYLAVEWLNSNPNTEIIASQPVSFYYTYGGIYATIKASAYKKITYKNIYPDIDVEYIFPDSSASQEMRNGIKYSLILHPGADPENIKMKYQNAENISLDSHKNVVIKSVFGEFIDHAPTIFYSNDQKIIPSAFSVKNNIVSFTFSPPSGKLEGGIIIDPWITNPAFPGPIADNSAFDINYDLNGNVYAYGYGFSCIPSHPFRLIKFNNSGVMQWIYTCPVNFGFIPMMGRGLYYGDFTVDEITGTSYIAEGANGYGTGSIILKVNTLGQQTDSFPGNPNLVEIWRVEYNRCINKIVLAGGGTGVTYQAAMLDTSLSSITPMNVFSTATTSIDVALLAIDNNTNYCYMLANPNPQGPPAPDKMIKCPLPNLLPLAFSVSARHEISEVSCGYASAGGFNGMAVSPDWLYTYNTDSLKKWDKNTGALIAGIDVSPLPTNYNWGVLRVIFGGLAADECDNVYVGIMDTIKEYNASLTLINKFPMPGTVYDLKLGSNNKLYACGQNFVEEMDVTPNNVSVIVSQTPVSDCLTCNGTATAQISCGNTSAFTYLWNTPIAQTTQTATGLCPGNYAVTLSANCFTGYTGTVTVTTVVVALTATVNTTNAACNGGMGTATVSIAGGTVPYTYNWLPSGGSTSAAIGLGAGTHNILVTDANGCVSTISVIITEPAALSATITATEASCGNYNGSATVIASGGTPIGIGLPYIYNWSSSAGTTANATGLNAGSYSVVITDVNGCTYTAFTVVTSTVVPPSANVGADITIKAGTSTTLTASGGVTYLWSTGATTTVISVAPTVTTTYTLIVTDANGCTGRDIVTVFIESADCDFFLPTAFSPNGDGENDELCLQGWTGCIKKFSIHIYDRWGEQVFQSGDNAFCWDGVYKNSRMNTGVFAYDMYAILITGEKMERKGNISIIR